MASLAQVNMNMFGVDVERRADESIILSCPEPLAPLPSSIVSMLRNHAADRAAEKALAVSRGEGEVVLAGDTTVAVGRRILPQAESEADVARFLRLLSGRRHRVHSAISVIDAQGRQRVRCASSQVRFKSLCDEEIAAYAASGEGIGKAGGYAIQGRAAGLIDFLSGTHSGVVGLPLFDTRALLKAAGIAVG
mgnify:CR=1 FL=1